MCKNHSDWFAKTISESIEIQLEVDGLKIKYRRFNQVWDGFTWLLARNASGIGTPYGSFRIYKHVGILDDDGSVQSPSIAVIFRETVNEVEIIGIRPSHPETYLEDLDF